MIYLISMAVFSGIIFSLTGVIMLVEARIMRREDCTVSINNDPDKAVRTPSGGTLLGALSANGIFLPSACGGSGSCGTCKCRVDGGAGDVLPTELPHLSRREIKENIRLACQVKVKEDMNIRLPDEIFHIRKYGAVVVSNENVATFIKELVLRLEDEPLNFKAGAYIQIDIPEYETAFTGFNIEDQYRPDWDKYNLWGLRSRSDEVVFRAYSLANPPSEGEVLKFTIRIAAPPPGRMDLPPGVGSSYVFHLQPGDRVTLSGPYGDFFVKNTEREICFIGGGAGMAPMRSHILDQLRDQETGRKISFWYGARSCKEMFYDEEFKALAEKKKNFSYNVALSDPLPEDNWEGMVGFIHQCLHDEYLASHPDPGEIEYYLCGPPVMIDAVEEMLDSLGVEPEMIAYDKFG